jgi:hypothetical protein
MKSETPSLRIRRMPTDGSVIRRITDREDVLMPRAAASYLHPGDEVRVNSFGAEVSVPNSVVRATDSFAHPLQISDLVRAQDISEVAGHDDRTLLAWAGKNDRVVLTHDLATMVPALRLQGRLASATIVVSLG